MKNVTVPVGVPLPEVCVTFAARATALLEPAVIELGVTVSAVVVEARAATVKLTGAAVDPAYVVSPL